MKKYSEIKGYATDNKINDLEIKCNMKISYYKEKAKIHTKTKSLLIRLDLINN
jgi:hypothetical protein